ncbi:MAG TPA: metallopeptidase family protein [Ktedonobacteraceae bacterium]|nr:metallopeptidase family protein [Ktedonobacteraceae bacterium]
MQQKSTGDDEPDEYADIRGEAGARPFFAVVSFLIAAILLAVFLNSSSSEFVQLLLLLGMLVFGTFGVVLLEKNSRVSKFLQTLTDEGKDVEAEEDAEPDELADENQAEDNEPEPSALTPFELLVQEALASIPAEFHDYMQNVAVLIESKPDEETLERVGTEEGHILLGLYQGVSITGEGYQQSLFPKRITIYQDNIEYYCHGDAQRIRDQVRKTVLHEVAHHFGIDHEEMPIWVR